MLAEEMVQRTHRGECVAIGAWFYNNTSKCAPIGGRMRSNARTQADGILSN